MLRIYKADFSKKVKNIEAWTNNCILIKIKCVYKTSMVQEFVYVYVAPGLKIIVKFTFISLSILLHSYSLNHGNSLKQPHI